MSIEKLKMFILGKVQLISIDSIDGEISIDVDFKGVVKIINNGDVNLLKKFIEKKVKVTIEEMNEKSEVFEDDGDSNIVKRIITKMEKGDG